MAACYFVTGIPLDFLEEFQRVGPIGSACNLFLADLHGGEQGLPLLVGLPHMAYRIPYQLGGITVEARIHLLFDIGFIDGWKMNVYRNLSQPLP